MMAENQVQAREGRPLNLPIPKSFDGTAESWGKWRARFDRYRSCTGLETKSNKEQVSTFLYSMGDIADDLLVTMNVDEDTVTYIELLEKFNNHFSERKNLMTSRAHFNKRVQAVGEPVRQFYSGTAQTSG